MGSKTTINKIKKMEKRENDLKKELISLENERNNMITRLHLCAIFDESLIKVISELLTLKEEEIFVPFMYKNYTSIFTNGFCSAENDCIGITKEEYLPIFNQTSNKEKLFEKKYGYDMICVNTELLKDEKDIEDTSVREYNLDKDYSKRLFSFEFLLNDIDSSAYTYPVRICKCNFNEFNYVQNYIRYIFDLQVQNSFTRLNYEEMKKAMNDFLELEKKKIKIRK